MDNKLYPVYIILFSNDTDFGKMIRKYTGSDYSHATISLDPSLNNMYSFSDIPYSHAKFTGAGFVRESLWSPMYKKNRYFTILVTFVNKNDFDTIQSKINYFKENYTKFKYNDIGLIQYYLNFKETKGHSEEKKKFWFCSEFVSYMCKAGNLKEFNDIMLAPGDIKNLNTNSVINLGDFNIPKFNEADLVMKTEKARNTFIKNLKNTSVSESFYFDYVDVIKEAGLKDLIKFKKKDFKESELHPYTQLIDWKFLYNEFIKLFPNTDPGLRFDLFELIIRKLIVPFKRKADNVTYEIDVELKNIYRIIRKRTISAINVVKSLIYINDNDRKIVFSYPIMNVVHEGYEDIDTMINKFPSLINNVKCEMFETFFE